MEDSKNGRSAESPKEITPQRLGEVIPMADLMDALFRGFAPVDARDGCGRSFAPVDARDEEGRP